MEGQLESQVTEMWVKLVISSLIHQPKLPSSSQTPGIVGVICTDKQGLSLAG